MMKQNDGKNKGISTEFHRLKDSQRYDLFINWNKKEIAIDKIYQDLLVFNGKYWEVIDKRDLKNIIISFFKDMNHSYNFSELERLEKTIHSQLQPIGKQNRDFIAFNNGVVNKRTGEFLPHNRDYFLKNGNEIDFYLEKRETPHFDKWLNWTSKGDPIKNKTILAALFMILGNFYEWQLFLEITGQGGTGKSVFNSIAMLLAGKGNYASVNIKDLENPSARDIILNKSFLFAPDQGRIATDGAVLKGITGEDQLSFNPKFKKAFNDSVKAVFLITDNEPLIFTEHSGGISRRRVLFLFSEKVPENIKDPYLMSKIEKEIPSVINLLIDTFKKDNSEAQRLLIAQRDGTEALDLKMQQDHIMHFASFFETRADINEKMKQGAVQSEQLFHQGIYSLYKRYCQLNEINKINKRAFIEPFKQALKEHGNNYPYRTEERQRNIITNVYLKRPYNEIQSEWEN